MTKATDIIKNVLAIEESLAQMSELAENSTNWYTSIYKIRDFSLEQMYSNQFKSAYEA